MNRTAAIAATTALGGLAIAFAPPATADQYDYLDAVDNHGIYYDNTTDMIDMGKIACSMMRKGSPITLDEQIGDEITVGGPIVAQGYAPSEAAIITVAAASNMCPDQLPKLQAIANSATSSASHRPPPGAGPNW